MLGVFGKPRQQSAVHLAQVEHLQTVSWHRVGLEGRPVGAHPDIALGSELREGRHEHASDAGNEDTFAHVGGEGRGAQRAGRHPTGVARAGEGHEERTFAQVVPDLEPGQVAGHVVEVGKRPGQ